MPAHRVRPLPPARMVELLAERKRTLLAEQGHVTATDFAEAWDAAWAAMVAERGWPHASEHRRQWRQAMMATRSESRATFLGQRTAFGDLAEALTAAAERMQVHIDPSDLPTVIIGAISQGYLNEQDEHENEQGVAA